MKFYKTIILHIFSFLLFSSCINPFAPTLDENIGSKGSLISDLHDIEGVFQNLQYAYTFKDTSIYSELLDQNFTFTFRDYVEGIDKAWGRDGEMQVTNSLFNNVERLDLIWNNIIAITSDSTNVIRSFNLTVTFSPTTIDFIDGKVNLQLEKSKVTNKWKILTWIDESNF